MRDRVALAAALVAPLLVTAGLAPFRDHFSNTHAALVLVAVVVAVAANGYRVAGYLAALSAAVWFDFFLTSPYFSLDIAGRSDLETTGLLLVIGAAVTELAVWGRRQAVAAQRWAGYVSGVHATAGAMAAAAGPAQPSEVVRQVSEQLIRLLDLSACRFQHGKAGIGVSARLRHDGSVVVDKAAWPVDAAGWPARDVELLVESGGYLRGRFLLTPAEGARPALENRLLAIALADQVGTVLGS